MPDIPEEAVEAMKRAMLDPDGAVAAPPWRTPMLLERSQFKLGDWVEYHLPSDGGTEMPHRVGVVGGFLRFGGPVPYPADIVFVMPNGEPTGTYGNPPPDRTWLSLCRKVEADDA